MQLHRPPATDSGITDRAVFVTTSAAADSTHSTCSAAMLNRMATDFLSRHQSTPIGLYVTPSWCHKQRPFMFTVRESDSVRFPQKNYKY